MGKKIIIFIFLVLLFSCEKKNEAVSDEIKSEEAADVTKSEEAADVTKSEETADVTKSIDKRLNSMTQDEIIQSIIEKNEGFELFLTQDVEFFFYLVDDSVNSVFIQGYKDVISFVKSNIDLSQIINGGDLLGFDLKNPIEKSKSLGVAYKYHAGVITFFFTKDKKKIDGIVFEFDKSIYDSLGYKFNPNPRQDSLLRFQEKKIKYGPYYAPFSKYLAIELYDDDTCYIFVHGLEGIGVEAGEYEVDGNNLYVKSIKWDKVFNFVVNNDGTLSTKTGWDLLYRAGGHNDEKLLKGMRYNFKTFELYDEPVIIE